MYFTSKLYFLLTNWYLYRFNRQKVNKSIRNGTNAINYEVYMEIFHLPSASFTCTVIYNTNATFVGAYQYTLIDLTLYK